mgnify:CR=1 FL=1
MTHSQTHDAGKLRLAAERKRDKSILVHIRDKLCGNWSLLSQEMLTYTIFLNFEPNEEKAGKLYENSYEYFCEEVIKKKLIITKEIMFMSTLFKAFEKVVSDKEGLDASNYRAHRLKAKKSANIPRINLSHAWEEEYQWASF